MPWSLFLNVEFQASSFTLFFHPHQESQFLLLFVIKVISSAYLRLLIFLPACVSSSSAFRMMYSAYNLNKHWDNMQLCDTYYPFLKQSVVSCLVLTFASCTVYKVSQETGKVVRYSYLLKNFPQFVMIHIVKSFSVVIEAEIDFFKFPCLFCDPMDVGNFSSGFSALSKSNLHIWKFWGDGWLNLAWRILVLLY